MQNPIREITFLEHEINVKPASLIEIILAADQCLQKQAIHLEEFLHVSHEELDDLTIANSNPNASRDP